MSRHLRAYHTTPQRRELIAEIKVAIDTIVANEDSWGLQLVVEITGWLSNRRDHTWGEMELVLGALLPLMSLSHLRDVRSVAVFHVKSPHADKRTERAA